MANLVEVLDLLAHITHSETAIAQYPVFADGLELYGPPVVRIGNCLAELVAVTVK